LPVDIPLSTKLLFGVLIVEQGRFSYHLSPCLLRLKGEKEK